LQSIQQDLAWERCRQLQAEDVVITGKVSNKLEVVVNYFLFLLLCLVTL
jgi:hypothetical protein